ncbi:MAG: glycoside hydrolase family 38 C-terminal domain-containing protein [Bacteroides sp.]|nr:glycoside hydrolase family 38 C-terminal domain-containing protein [Bacteroides sp.]
MYLKQANFDAERWIQYFAEPFNVFSAWLGRDILDQYPETAWEFIVQNSAHDSIGGCSLDRIHEDMMIRFKHSVEISKGILDRSLKFLLQKLNTSVFNAGENAVFITAVNTTNFTRCEIVKVWIDIPAKYDKGFLRILDGSGNECNVQLVDRQATQPILEQMINRPMYFDMIRYCAYIQTPDIPSFGLKSMLVLPSEKTVEEFESESDFALENEYLKVHINPDGSLNVFDKELLVEYKNQAYLYDEGESGHAWVNKPVAPFTTTLNENAKIHKTINGILYNEYEIIHELLLPADLASRNNDSGVLRRNKVIFVVGLSRGSRHLDIRVIVDNQSESHRLRLMFPSGINASYSYGEGQFDVPARSLERLDTKGWIEQPMMDYPVHHFVDVNDGIKGLAILVDGLKEYEVLNDEFKTIAITLFRTFEYKINPAAPQDYSFEKGSQMLGRNEFRLALFPHRGSWIDGNVYREAFLFNYDLRLVQTGQLNGEQGSSMSFLKIEPESLIFSCLKKAESNSREFVLRIYNPTSEAVSGRIRAHSRLKTVEEVTLEEIIQKEIQLLDNNSFEVLVHPRKIKTYKLTLFILS